MDRAQGNSFRSGSCPILTLTRGLAKRLRDDPAHPCTVSTPVQLGRIQDVLHRMGLPASTFLLLPPCKARMPCAWPRQRDVAVRGGGSYSPLPGHTGPEAAHGVCAVAAGQQPRQNMQRVLPPIQRALTMASSRLRWPRSGCSARGAAMPIRGRPASGQRAYRAHSGPSVCLPLGRSRVEGGAFQVTRTARRSNGAESERRGGARPAGVGEKHASRQMHPDSGSLPTSTRRPNLRIDACNDTGACRLGHTSQPSGSSYLAIRQWNRQT
jgi:hypothetical protein